VGTSFGSGPYIGEESFRSGPEKGELQVLDVVRLLGSRLQKKIIKRSFIKI
jgi:hypothetical protein